MVNVITQLFKYMVALIMAIYTIRCFTVFSVKKEKKKAKDLQKPEFSDALDSSHALYDYFSE